MITNIGIVKGKGRSRRASRLVQSVNWLEQSGEIGFNNRLNTEFARRTKRSEVQKFQSSLMMSTRYLYDFLARPMRFSFVAR